MKSYSVPVFSNIPTAPNSASIDSRGMFLTMNTMRERRSSLFQRPSFTGGWKMCCTPWMASGPASPATLMMPLTRQFHSGDANSQRRPPFLSSGSYVGLELFGLLDCNALSPVSALGVRRAKAALSSGCKPHPATAPAGSNRSSYGGNDMA